MKDVKNILLVLLTVLSLYLSYRLYQSKKDYAIGRKHAPSCTEWNCNHVGQLCMPDAEGSENKTWICDGATWHQVVQQR